MLDDIVFVIEEPMDIRLTDAYKEKETGDIKPRLRRATMLSERSKEKALKGFKGLDGKEQDIKVRTGIIRDNIKHK